MVHMLPVSGALYIESTACYHLFHVVSLCVISVVRSMGWVVCYRGDVM